MSAIGYGGDVLRKQSAKARNVAAERTLLRAGYLENGLLWCESCPVRGRTMENGLIQRFTDLHERILRSRGGDATDEANIIRLCRDCHEFCHKNPTWATEHNFMAHASSIT